MSTEEEIDMYKIVDLLDPSFEDYKYWQVDFRRHLLPTISLEKDVEHDEEGRPVDAIYYVDGFTYAKAKWTFENSPNSELMISRKVEICYVAKDETDGPWFTIKDETFDVSSSAYHRNVVLQERVTSRHFILNDLKAIVMSTLKVLAPGKTELEISEMGADFLETHNAEIGSFLEAGSKHIVTSILADTTTTWLDNTFQAGPPIVTLRTFMSDKLNF